MRDDGVPDYSAFLPAPLVARLLADAEDVPGVPGLRVARGLRDDFAHVETTEALTLVVEVFRQVAAPLAQVLRRRARDRAFLDAAVQDMAPRNAARSFDAADYETPIGLVDHEGRVVMGPIARPTTPYRAHVPAFMQGDQVTLFGPPDTAKLAINAMNAIHRRRADEPEIVRALVDERGQVARWGADNEDSKTPIMRAYLQAGANLMGCFDGSLAFVDDERGKRYSIERERRSIPVKRVPGLALPDGAHLLDGRPLPLHLFDLVTHLWHNRAHDAARIFYMPKLENDEEAAYLRALIEACERAIASRDPLYVTGKTQALVVFENPRAIFRIEAIARALGPHFLGGSLGWHDFLASTARLFMHDPRYRIPVKADPNIVIHHIKESHDILSKTLGGIGALKLGGMYGVLPDEGDDASFSVAMQGFIKDVVTQMKRGLDGFWVAHPDFVRTGLALVAAWRRREKDPSDDALHRLVKALVEDPRDHVPLLAFVDGPDVPGLSPDDPRYLRGVLAADVATSTVIANDHPDEVRYNVFQALQYLADWLAGNGCVALPASMKDRDGNKIFVRIMDDLATTERSRWELFAEVHHGRVSRALFEQILDEEVAFLRADQDTATRRIQVRWRGECARYYPIAVKLLRQLVLTTTPPEFVPELILPFTFDCVRESDDPWATAKQLCPGKFAE